MDCVIKFSLNNDSFVDNEVSEVKRILNTLSEKISTINFNNDDYININDSNGNTIGSLQIVGPVLKTKKYDFYADSGHGWLKVKRSELLALNVLHKISGYSYQNNDNVFLEEDCDTSIFIAAMKKQGIQVKIREHYTNRESKIRNYNSFCQ